MRGASAALLAAAGGFGLGLVALSVFHTTTVGNCASGPTPFEIANQCPSNDTYWTAALVASILLSIAAIGLIGIGITTPAIFFAVGGGCLASLASWDVHPNWLIAAIILPVVFFPVGVWMLRMASPPWSKTLPLVPLAAIGATGAVVAALAIPGPIAQPKSASAAASVPSSLTELARAPDLNRRLSFVAGNLGSSFRVSQISLKPGDTVIVVLVGGERHDVRFEGDGSIQDASGAGSSSDRAVPRAAVDTRAPERMLAELRRRFGLGVDRVESLYFGIDSARAPHWYVNLRGTAAYFQADAHGVGLRRLHD